MRYTAGAEEEEVPVLIVGGGGAGLTSFDAAGAPGRGASAGQRAAADL